MNLTQMVYLLPNQSRPPVDVTAPNDAAEWGGFRGSEAGRVCEVPPSAAR